MVETRALADATAAIVKEHLAAMIAPIERRLAAIEARASVSPDDLTALREECAGALRAAIDTLPTPATGERGETGAQGETGPAGADGRDGRDGVDGRDGIGLAGFLIDRGGSLIATTSDGKVHDLGLVVGRDGVDGRDGEPGPAGERGPQGETGPAGETGATGERGEAGAPGEVGPAGERGADAYAGTARGLHDPDAGYRAMDVASFNGCEWRAKRDDPGPLPGDGWMLSAARGKRGERGERGETGRDGAAGPGGGAIVAGYRDSGALVLTREDGSEIRIEREE